MRTSLAVLLCIVLWPAAISNPEQRRIPSVSAEIVTISDVRRGSEIGKTELGDSPDLLLVARPAYASEHSTSSVFRLEEDGVRLQRVQVWYGRASAQLIQIVDGVAAGDRIVVSDMRAWDRYDRLQLRAR